MRGFLILGMTIVMLGTAGCSSDPDAPVNQSFPVRQMDHFFDSLSPPPPAPAPDYTREPGYAPAYPPYQ